jgi:ribosome-associated protein
MVIKEGQVSVNGEVETRRGRKLYPGDTIALTGCSSFVIEQE